MSTFTNKQINAYVEQEIDRILDDLRLDLHQCKTMESLSHHIMQAAEKVDKLYRLYEVTK